MTDPSDFPIVEPAPLPDASLWLVMLLCVAAAALIAFIAGRWFERRAAKAARAKALDSIFEEIRKKASSAASASGEEVAVVTAAGALVKEIRDRLGKVTDFAGPLAGKLKAIESAVKGDAPQGSSGPAASATNSAGASDSSEGGSQSQSQSQAQVSVLATGNVMFATPQAQGGRSESAAQRVRLAVGDFADYWSAGKKAAIVRQMTDAADQLNKTASPPITVPKPPKKH